MLGLLASCAIKTRSRRRTSESAQSYPTKLTTYFNSERRI